MTYDAAGDLIRTTLSDNSYLSYAYDAAHRLITVANPLSESENLTLDAMGHVTQTLWNNALDVNTFKHAARFDAAGREHAQLEVLLTLYVLRVSQPHRRWPLCRDLLADRPTVHCECTSSWKFQS